MIANDPDADRCAVAVPTRDGGWRVLTGDEVGGLLAEHVLRHTCGDDRLVATTIVSSSLLRRDRRRARRAATPRRSPASNGSCRRRPPGLVFGYEEALGYSVGDAGARQRQGRHRRRARRRRRWPPRARRDGRTLLDLLDDQAREHGLHATSQLSIRVDGPGAITAAMARLRASPRRGWAAWPSNVDDLGHGADGLPPTDGLRFRLAGAPAWSSAPPGRSRSSSATWRSSSRSTDDIAAARARAAADLDPSARTCPRPSPDTP